MTARRAVTVLHHLLPALVLLEPEVAEVEIVEPQVLRRVEQAEPVAEDKAETRVGPLDQMAT